MNDVECLTCKRKCPLCLIEGKKNWYCHHCRKPALDIEMIGIKQGKTNKIPKKERRKVFHDRKTHAVDYKNPQAIRLLENLENKFIWPMVHRKDHKDKNQFEWDFMPGHEEELFPGENAFSWDNNHLSRVMTYQLLNYYLNSSEVTEPSVKYPNVKYDQESGFFGLEWINPLLGFAKSYYSICIRKKVFLSHLPEDHPLLMDVSIRMILSDEVLKALPTISTNLSYQPATELLTSSSYFFGGCLAGLVIVKQLMDKQVLLMEAKEKYSSLWLELKEDMEKYVRDHPKFEVYQDYLLKM